MNSGMSYLDKPEESRCSRMASTSTGTPRRTTARRDAFAEPGIVYRERRRLFDRFVLRERPARTRSTIWRRNSGGYAALLSACSVVGPSGWDRRRQDPHGCVEG